MMEKIKDENLHPECFFVSSCKSEEMGKVFFKAGAKHVICINRKFTVKDVVAIDFAKTFYYCLFSQ